MRRNNDIEQKKKILSAMLVSVLLVSPKINSKVYASIPSSCKAGAFLGWAENLETKDIMGDPAYSGKVNMVAFDVANWSDNDSDDNHKNNDATAIGDGPAGWHNANYETNFKNVAVLGKDTMVSAEIPNPEGQKCTTHMSSDDFSKVANAKITDSSDSKVVTNYQSMVKKLGDILADYYSNLNQKNQAANVYLRLFHEMNSSYLWWGFQDKEQFKKLWINLHDYLVYDRKFTWLKFCYAVNKGDENIGDEYKYTKDATLYYPGDNYVDTVALYGYSDDLSNDPDIQKPYAELTGGTYNGVTYKGYNKPFGFAELGAKVGGSYIDKDNNQIKPFDYQIWSNAIQSEYSKASYSIVFDKAYDPRNNIHGTSIFNDYKDANTSISYKAHVSNIGWQDYVKDAETAGTTGQTLSMEAIQMNYPNNIELHLQYQAHVSNIGWMSPVSDGQIAGTTGQHLSIEAINISLKDAQGKDSSDYSIYYRTHLRYMGWTSWTKNGSTSGTIGQSRPVEAIQVCVVKNGTERAQLMEGLVQGTK